MGDLAKYAKEHKIKFFLFNFTDLFGTQRAKLVPAEAAGKMQKAGAGFAGFATWLDMTPADPDMLAIAVRSAGLSDLLDHVLSVHDTRRFKTDPAAYQIGVDALQMPARDILFVSSNGWDAIGATWFGYTTLWVNRTGAPLERLGTPPDHQGATLREVLALFPA